MLWTLAIMGAIIFVVSRWLVRHHFGAAHRFYSVQSTFPILAKLEDKCDIIAQELQAGEWYLWPERHLWNKPGDVWRVCPLFGFDIWHPKNTKHFPVTCELLRQIPGLKTAVFSRLGPGTRLNPHQGWSKLANEVLRCHMGINVPVDGRSGVEVEGEFRQTRKGRWIVFDDSKYHIGLNESQSEDRIVLLLDIKRPWWVRRGQSNYHDMGKLDAFLKAVQQQQ